MDIKIIFNNEAVNNNFSTGWGFSCLVDGRILFDTGEKHESLFANMEIIGVNISGIEAVVISHDHWDHTGGLWEILKRNRGLNVYACHGFSRKFKEKVKKNKGNLIESNKSAKIAENIFITGEIPRQYAGNFMPEQALFVKTNNGMSVITGCAHPGIVQMLGKIKDEYPNEKIYSAFGGFHLMDKDKRTINSTAAKFKEMEIEKAGPAHCSGKEAEAIFKNLYKEDFITVKAGLVIDV